MKPGSIVLAIGVTHKLPTECTYTSSEDNAYSYTTHTHYAVFQHFLIKTYERLLKTHKGNSISALSSLTLYSCSQQMFSVCNCCQRTKIHIKAWQGKA